jgi:hypothetical protein
MRAFPGHPHLSRGVGLTILAALTSTCTPDRIPSALSSMATHLVFTAQPRSAVAGAPIGAITLKALDSSNNVVADFTAAVTIAIANNTGATLSGTTTVTADAGVATFSNIIVDKAGIGYTLTASSPAQTGAVSTPFDISAGAAARLVCTQQPSPTLGSGMITLPIQAAVVDTLNNTAPAFAGKVTATIVTPPGGTLSGSVTVTAVSGVATFSNLGIPAGSGYTLIVSSPGLVGATCGPF